MHVATTQELLGRDLNEVEQRHAPPCIWVEGDTSLLAPHEVRISIVGSRNASPEGLRRACKLARLVAAERIVVVSGLARGIDTAAHSAAMGANGRTIAVLGTGLDRCYPAENRDLQRQIATSHLVLSQFPPGTPPARRNFPLRNRTMALISDATVIVEAGDTSGSLSQGWEALRLARPLFILPSILEAGLEWPEKMLAYGARLLDATDTLLDQIPSPVPASMTAVAF